MEQYITEGDRVYNEQGSLFGIVDRTMASYRDYGEEAQIMVTLPCGYKERFFITSLSNEEYIKRTQKLKTFFHDE